MANPNELLGYSFAGELQHCKGQPSCLAPAGAEASAISSLFLAGIWDAQAVTGVHCSPALCGALQYSAAELQ